MKKYIHPLKISNSNLGSFLVGWAFYWVLYIPWNIKKVPGEGNRLLPLTQLLSGLCDHANSVDCFVGSILHWPISIFDFEPTINKAITNWETCSVSFSFSISYESSLWKEPMKSCLYRMSPIWDSWIFRSSLLSATASFLVASLGLLSMSAARRLVSYSLGASWSDTAVQATCTHLRQVLVLFSLSLALTLKNSCIKSLMRSKFLQPSKIFRRVSFWCLFSFLPLQYHTMRNVLYMAMTEFREVFFFW